MPLLDQKSLYRSTVVANCRMNRERQLVGTNSYVFDLRFDIPAWLRSLDPAIQARWGDICCGTGTALIEAAGAMQICSQDVHLSIEGIDLAGHFAPNRFEPDLILQKTSVEDWTPAGEYDLVTCVHGLHYIGDKLGAIKKMVNCLSKRGMLIANVDLANFRFADGRKAGRTVAKQLREQGITYETRTRLLKCQGGRIINFDLKYVGANDNAGPNYTGQSAVDSYYEG